MSQNITTSYNDLVSLIDFTLIETGEQDMLMNEAVQSGVFIQKMHPNKTGDTQRFTEMDFELYAKKKGEGVNAAIFKTQLGYSIDAPLRRFGFNVEYSYEFDNYTKNFEVESITRAALRAQANRMDLDLQQRISQLTATSYTNMDGDSVSVAVGDGLALGSTVHTLLASALTYRARVANNPAFSSSSLALAEQTYAENCYNHFGQKAYKKLDTIISTDNSVQINNIRRELNSTADTSALNAGVKNVNANKYKHVVFSKIAVDPATGAPDTTKREYWGIVATGENGWQAYYALNEPAHRMTENVNAGNCYDVRKDMFSIPFRIGYSNAVLSARGSIWSTGNGVA